MRIQSIRIKRSRWRMAMYVVTLLSAQGLARAGSVRVQPVQNCAQQPRITVLRDGKPAIGVRVEVYRLSEHPIASQYQDRVGLTLRTDAKGEVILPKLPPSTVRVVAHWSSGSCKLHLVTDPRNHLCRCVACLLQSI